MKGSRKRGATSSGSLNDMSSEEDTGSSSSDYEQDADTFNQVPIEMNNASSNSPNITRNSELASDIMQPNLPSAISSESNVRNEGSVSQPDSPQPSSSVSENPTERDLSQEEVDKLVQLQDLTGIDDLEICRALLESKGWDLEATAREQFDPPDSREQNQPQRLEPHDEAPEASHYQNMQPSPPVLPNRNMGQDDVGEQRLPDQRSQNRNYNNSSSHSRSNYPVTQNANLGPFGFLRWGFYLITLPIAWPVRLAYNTFTNMFGFLADVFGFGHLFGPFRQGNQRGRRFLPRPPVTDPRVYLHCPSHQDTDEFCERVICSPELTNFTSEQNVIFWACSVDSGEGYRVSEALHESTYPFLAVIVLRQNRMMIVGRLEGAPPNPQLVTERLNSVVRDNEAFIVAARADRAERHMTQTIRQEQDEALQDALRQDQEKERKKKEQEELEKRAEEEERRRVEQEQDRKDRIARAKIDYASRVPDEPDTSASDAIRIVIKLPEGQRLERRFLKTESMKYLYYYVFCHPESPDDFDITTNFPRKVLNCKPSHLMRDLGLNDLDDQMNDESDIEPPTFEAAGIGQSTMLFVNDLEA